jgi:MFS family permease
MSAKLAGKLFTQRRFLPLFILFQAGTFNDNALKNALIALVLTGGITLFSGMPQESVIPLAAILFTGPFLILCAIAGQIADKVDRGVILKRIKRVEVGIMILASIGFLFQNAFILCLALVCMGGQSAFFSPTKNAVLPQWLEDDELITGNGLLSGFQFFTILLGTVFGTVLFQIPFAEDSWLTASRFISIVLLFLAVIGWLAGERVPIAPAPKPDLKIDYNPVTAIFKVLKFAWADQAVFRPMLGIAWFYGLSTIMITALPNYVYNVMQYDLYVLSFIQAATTIGILAGSLLCVVIAKGREAVGLMATGIVGVTIFSADLYLNNFETSRTVQASLPEFFEDPQMPRFMAAIFLASLFNGLFVIPLQAMAQGRSTPERRARLMAAGAVMLNLSVNLCTIMLIRLGYLDLAPNVPFLIIATISAIVSAYAIWRWLQIRKEKVQ